MLKKIFSYIVATLSVAIVFGGIGFILLFYGILSYAFVTFKFYYWFVVPVFPDVVALSFYQILFLRVFLVSIRGQQKSPKADKNEDKTQLFLGVLATPWSLLLTGYVVKSLISLP